MTKLQALKKWLEGRGYPIEKMFMTQYDWCLIMTRKGFNKHIIHVSHEYFHVTVMRCTSEEHWRHDFKSQNDLGFIKEVIE